MDQRALDGVVRLLDLEPIEMNIFRGQSPDEDRQRTFGGQVAGQSLVAAARTVDDGHTVHSLHAYFLRAGDPGTPILYEVDRIRDGRSFTTRRVVAIQHGKAIFHMSASFQTPEEGFEHQFESPVGDTPPPETLPDFATRYAHMKDQLGDWYDRPRAIDMRYVDWEPEDRRAELPPRQRVWMRAAGTLGDDPLLHACLVTYASDMTLLDTALLPHGTWHDPDVFMASLDHAMWFHRPFRADEWILYDQDTPSASGGRGIARGLMWDPDGNLLISVVQEGLIRRMRTTK
ncbi:acyl-CoA thioesterase II [Actinospongicola halichondriae]|uniref:acyl-CoA thioesterase II n=1 Tax=Actinospongicola halichondriae TaxID=3236844 RepID=UPI003D4AEE61